MLLVGALAQADAFAQSGKPNPAPTSKPTPTPEGTSSNRGEARQNLATDLSADTYRLVFPTRLAPGLTDFDEQLNRAGVERYKLISAVYRWQQKTTPPKDAYSVPVAILKLDEVQHEYASFETVSNSLVAIDGFDQRYKHYSLRGFRFVEQFMTSASCDETNALGVIFGGACKIHHRFITERQRGVEKPIQFIVANSPPSPGFKTKMADELTSQIKEKLVDGFYPTAVFSAWEILLTHAGNSNDLIDNPDVRVVTSFDVRGRVNDLAKQGYRLMLIEKRGAVMYRSGPTATPLTYISLKVRDKRFGEQLAKLQETGAVYRMTYTGDSGIEDQLMFEQGPVGEGKRREYKVLRFDFEMVQGPNSEVRVDLTPSAKETMKLLNTLAVEGFVVRDLFVSESVSNNVSVLLERSH